MRIKRSGCQVILGIGQLCIFRRLTLLFAGFVIMQLAGCVNIPKQAFNREAHKDVLAIGVLEPPAIVEYPVVNLGHPGLGFGLIGGLIAAADIQAKTDEFTRRLKSRNFDARAECQSALTKELAQAGYQSMIIPVRREPRGFVQAYEGIDAKVDAYLDVVCSAGYLSAGPASPYVPTVMLNVRMVKRTTREIVYQEIISYGYENRFLKAVSIAAESQYNFSNFETLTQNDERALEGIRKGIPVLARRLVQDLSGPKPPVVLDTQAEGAPQPQPAAAPVTPETVPDQPVAAQPQ